MAGIRTVISTHDRRGFDERIAEGNFHIAVIVYEKLQALLVNSPKLLAEVGLIVVDELQYISDEDRGQTLELLLTKILLLPESPQLVGLYAVLGKPERLSEWLKAQMLIQEKRPVELLKGVFFDGKFSYREFNNRLVKNGYDTPEAIAGLPLGELERILTARLAQRRQRYCYNLYGPQGRKVKEAHPAGGAPVAGEEQRVGEAPVGVEPPAGEGEPESEAHQIRSFAEIVANDGLLARFRSSLALTDNLAQLVTGAPEILIDERQNLFFYAGFRVELAPTTFKFMGLLAIRPGEVVSRSEIYEHLWPESPSNPDYSSNPYDRQISDHKRKIAVQTKKAVKGKAEIDPDQIKNLIRTRRKVGYMLDLKREEVCIFFLDNGQRYTRTVHYYFACIRTFRAERSNSGRVTFPAIGGNDNFLKVSLTLFRQTSMPLSGHNER